MLAGNGNAIHVEKSTHIWIDHNDLSSDTSHGTDYITVSWNYEHDHIKCRSTRCRRCRCCSRPSRSHYFENTPNTVVTQTGDSPAGNVELLNNYLANSGTPQTRNGAGVAAIPYAYTADANSSVKSIVTASAGTGKI